EDRPADKGVPQKDLQQRQHQQRNEARDQHPQRQIDKTEMQARADIGRLDKTVIDAKDQDQRHLGDKQKAKEEGQALDRLFAAALEGIVIDLIYRHADNEEDRR